MEKLGVFDVIRSFLEAYGWSFLILVGMGFLTALLAEATVKKPIEWLEKKWAGNEKRLAILQAVKMIVLQIFVWTLCIWFGCILQKGMPLPGNGALLPFWIGAIYGIQLIFSMFVVKRIFEHREEKKEKEPEPKEKLEKTEVRGVFRNEAGQLVDKHNEPIKF